MSDTLALDKFLSALDRRVGKHLDGLPAFHQGVVQGFDPSTRTAQVTLNDDPTLLQAAVIGSYTPISGDLVEVRVQKGYLVVHGPTAGAGTVSAAEVAITQLSVGGEYWRSAASAVGQQSANATTNWVIDTQIPFLQITADGVSYYRVVALARPGTDVNGTTMDMAVLDGGDVNPVGGAVGSQSAIIAQASAYIPITAGPGGTNLICEMDWLFTTGLHTLGVAFRRTAGTGNVYLASATNQLKELTVFNPKGMRGDVGSAGPAGPAGPIGPSGPPGASYNTTINSPAISTPYSVTHNLNTTFPIVQLWDAVNGQLLDAEVTMVDANHVTVTFLTQPLHAVGVVVAAGTPGGGAAAQTYQYSQAVASGVWTITHNLGYYPNVAVVDSAGTQIFPGSMVYNSVNQVTLTFSSAVGGFAYLS